MTTFADRPLEEQIAQWRAYVRRRQAIHGPDVEELEGHLRDQLMALTEAGLAGDEAFLVAVKRMGSLDALSREFGRAHSERLWKQLVIAGDADASANTAPAETLVVLGLAVAAALAVKVPALFGHPINPNEELPLFYARNASLFTFPLLAVYFLWKRGSDVVSGLLLALPFAAGAVFANVYPFRMPRSDTSLLTVLHLPIALWLAVGFAYVRSRWFADGGRMNFVRFSGELAIYYVLIALGGFVLMLFTFMMFRAIDMNPDWFVAGWLLPCGAAGAVIVGSWLVEAKQSVIENMAPVLTRLFTPLFTVLLLAFLATMAWTGNPVNVKREVLDRFRSAADRRRWAGALCRLRARPAGIARLLRRSATAARGQRARGRWRGALGDRRPHLRVWLHSQPGGGSWRESHSARQPGVVGAALCALPASAGIVCRPGAMADCLSCPSTPYGRHWWLSCSRPCSATVDALTGTCTAKSADYRGGAGAGGSLPPSASVFMFWSACVNLSILLALSAARAASSGSIELSKNNVYTIFEVVAVTGLASSVP